MATSFDPTIEIIISDDVRERIESTGRTVEQAFEGAIKDYQENALGPESTFTPEWIRHIATGVIVHNFTAYVVGYFTRDDILHLHLSTDDIVAMTF